MAAYNKVTEIALDWHADGQDNAHVICNTSEEIVQAMIDDYGLELTDAQATQLEVYLHEIVDNSIDWDALSEADDELRDYVEAKRDAIYK